MAVFAIPRMTFAGYSVIPWPLSKVCGVSFYLIQQLADLDAWQKKGQNTSTATRIAGGHTDLRHRYLTKRRQHRRQRAKVTVLFSCRELELFALHLWISSRWWWRVLRWKWVGNASGVSVVAGQDAHAVDLYHIDEVWVVVANLVGCNSHVFPTRFFCIFRVSFYPFAFYAVLKIFYNA